MEDFFHSADTAVSARTLRLGSAAWTDVFRARLPVRNTQQNHTCRHTLGPPGTTFTPHAMLFVTGAPWQELKTAKT